MWLWEIFIGFVIICLVLDLGVFNKKDHIITTKQAAIQSSIWVGLALLFSGVIYWLFSAKIVDNPTNLSPDIAFIDYITGYLIELSLSIDNIFVIAVIFSAFKIPAKYQHRVLFWGIIGAVVFRGVMIVFGIRLIEKFDWIIYVFGVFLIYTAFTMLKDKEASNPKDSWWYKAMAKVLPVTDEIRGHAFITKINGKRFVTPLLLALIVIEFSDVIFALDSIPAILAINQHEFIVFSSNIMAVLGLRALFFLIIGVMEKFRFINFSLAGILGFVGIKMLLSGYFHIPSWVSLILIVVFIAGGILASIYIPPKNTSDIKE